MKILHLTLSKKPFEVMVTGEKQVEFRSRSQWILSRLFDQKTQEPKEYDAIKFTNGYGSDKPYFICRFYPMDWSYAPRSYKTPIYSNGLQVEVKQGDVRLHLSSIIETGNLANQ